MEREEHSDEPLGQSLNKHELVLGHDFESFEEGLVELQDVHLIHVLLDGDIEQLGIIAEHCKGVGREDAEGICLSSDVERLLNLKIWISLPLTHGIGCGSSSVGLRRRTGPLGHRAEPSWCPCRRDGTGGSSQTSQTLVCTNPATQFWIFKICPS